LIVAGLVTVYKASRLLASDSDLVAVANAWRLLEWQTVVHLPREQSLQGLLLTSEAVTSLANAYYAWLHFPVTAAFMIWVFTRHRDRYVLVRRQLALLTGLALVVHMAFPLAPPRMLGEAGFIDTAAVYGPTVYGSPGVDSVSNQFAAMPSLHFGWSLVVAVGVVRLTRSRWRWLWLAHPACTLVVIVTTGNHFWLDAAVAAMLLAAAERTVRAHALPGVHPSLGGPSWTWPASPVPLVTTSATGIPGRGVPLTWGGLPPLPAARPWVLAAGAGRDPPHQGSGGSSLGAAVPAVGVRRRGGGHAEALMGLGPNMGVEVAFVLGHGVSSGVADPGAVCGVEGGAAMSVGGADEVALVQQGVTRRAQADEVVHVGVGPPGGRDTMWWICRARWSQPGVAQRKSWATSTARRCLGVAMRWLRPTSSTCRYG